MTAAIDRIMIPDLTAPDISMFSMNRTQKFAIGTIAGAALVVFMAFALSFLFGTSAADREIEKLIAENRDAALKKLKQISAANDQAQQEARDVSAKDSTGNASAGEQEAETIRRFATLSPRPNFDITSPDGNALVMPGTALAEVKLALEGKYDRRYGMWYGPHGQIGEAVPKAAMCVGIVPRPKQLDVRPDQLKQWFAILPKVRYILDYAEWSDSAVQISDDTFGGGFSTVEVRLFDVESGHWLGKYKVSASSSSSVTVTKVEGEDTENSHRASAALADDLSSGMSGQFKAEFKRYFPWEK